MIRDTKIAGEAQQRVQLGWLDQEFTVYGTAYRAQGEMLYRVSNASDHIYTFLDEAGVRDIYPANLSRYTERCPLPSGLKEEKNLEVKKTLARRLRDAYPEELFRLLSDVAERVRDDFAYSLLDAEREALEGAFDSVRLGCFSELVRYSYKTLKLTSAHYNALMHWIAREYRNLEDDFVPKKTSEGKLYAMLYLEQGEARYIADALREYVYARKFELEQAGRITTPLYLQRFWYDYRVSFREAKAEYTAQVRRLLEQHYLGPVRQIRVRREKVSRYGMDFPAVASGLEREMGAPARDTFVRYLHQWDLA